MKFQQINWKNGTVVLVLISIFISFLISSCQKDITRVVDNSFFNPYDTINYNQNAVPDVPVDSSSFLGIHKYILSVKCAVSGCHDGSFEPDYRTVQSAYSTLLY